MTCPIVNASGTSCIYRFQEDGRWSVFYPENTIESDPDEVRRLAIWLLETACLMEGNWIYVAPPATQEEIEKLRVDWEAMYRGCPKRPCKINE